MERVRILTTFDAYPNGRKVAFAQGATVAVAAEFAALIITKGLAEPAGPSTPAADKGVRKKKAYSDGTE